MECTLLRLTALLLAPLDVLHAADTARALAPDILWIVMDDVGAELISEVEEAPRESACPQEWSPVPALLRRAGCFTSNGDHPLRGKRLGKTDYNFEWDPEMYLGNDWVGREPGQPFFAQIQLWGGKNRNDNGISHARGKQFLYDEGIRTPFIVRGPGIARGAFRSDLIDMAATSLAWAGLPMPSSMQGRDIFAKDFQKREIVFAARDRCGETVDRIRSVRTEKFKYIRNFHPQRPLLQPNDCKDTKPFMPALRELHAQGKLSPLQEEILFPPTRPAEELYDVRTDSFETRNLAAEPTLQSTLETLRARLDRWMIETRDRGPESELA